MNISNFESFKYYNYMNDHLNTDDAKTKAVHKLYSLKWGPTKVPIYNLLGISCQVFPRQRLQLLAVTRWLSTVVKVPVDGTDVSGTTALAHSISTHPAFDPEFAQILYDAGGDVNMRNRYGATPAHDMSMDSFSGRARCTEDGRSPKMVCHSWG
jgi:hypothetical protein